MSKKNEERELLAQLTLKKEPCDCDVNHLLAEAKKDWWWAKCLRWNDKTWFLWCPKHRVYLSIEEAQP